MELDALLMRAARAVVLSRCIKSRTLVCKTPNQSS